MILDKIAKNIKKNRPKKVTITARGYKIYYGVIILIVLIIGFSKIFSQ